MLPDLPLPDGVWGLPVAEVSAHFTPPWPGKFSRDCFHPSQAGYRDRARALLAAIPADTRTPARSALKAFFPERTSVLRPGKPLERPPGRTYPRDMARLLLAEPR